MRIFLSHSGKQKPLIREIKNHLPEHLGMWIDEDKLIFGDNIEKSIESVITQSSDYVILFIDEYAVKSDWVNKEVEWTIKTEKENNRTILLPVVIDKDALDKINEISIKNRKYLTLQDYKESSVSSLAQSITTELFALVCREIEQIKNPTARTALSSLADADSVINKQAELIRKIVFPHRETNPISHEKLFEVMNHHNDEQLSYDDFESLMSAIIQRNLIPGFVYDGIEAYLREEHASWKSNLQHDRKKKIGRAAASYIKNNTKIFFDAGSTSEEIVNVLCKKIENRAIQQILVATTSVNIADMVSDCCVDMGFDDDFTAVSLYIPGGRVRPNTQAIVPAFENGAEEIEALSRAVGGFDLCFVGVNAVTLENGFMTHNNSEVHNKEKVLNISSKRIIIGDSSKVGLNLECAFAYFEDDILFIVDDDSGNMQLQKISGSYPDKLRMV